MKIAVLLENTTLSPALACEHGLSLYMETETARILFDAGQTEAFWDNAEKMGIDLRAVDFAVLSHGHYDHGGGLKRFLRENTSAPVYATALAFRPHYHGKDKYIGLDPSLDRSRFRFVTGKTQIAPGITLDPCESRLEPPPEQGLHMLVEGKLLPEDFRHEQYLILEEKGRKYVFSGCSHRGIENIFRWLTPDVFIGGLHLSKVRQEDALQTIAAALSPTPIHTGHCTGKEQFHILKKTLGENLHALSTGMILEL